MYHLPITKKEPISFRTLELGAKRKPCKFHTRYSGGTSPIDSFVRVLPAPMPGYPFDEVMAAGSAYTGKYDRNKCRCSSGSALYIIYAGWTKLRIWKAIYPTCTNKYE